MQSIVTLTMNPAIDKSTSVDHVVADRKLRCQSPQYEPGGGGINVSRAIRQLGGASVALYPAGGMTGQMLRALLDQEGLTHSPLPITGLTRENLMVLEEATGQQFRFGMPGPTLQEGEWQHCLARLSTLHPTPDYLVASGSLPPGVPTDFYARVGDVATHLGARLIVDASGEALRAAACKGIYLLKPNIRELKELVGDQMQEEIQPAEAAKKLLDRDYCQVVVVSLGAGGAVLVSADGQEHIRTPTVPIKSKVGAGDSMVAGMVLSLARGNSLSEAVRFGVAAGAAAVMTPGTGLCRREDTERLYQQIRAEQSGNRRGKEIGDVRPA